MASFKVTELKLNNPPSNYLEGQITPLRTTQNGFLVGNLGKTVAIGAKVLNSHLEDDGTHHQMKGRDNKNHLL